MKSSPGYVYILASDVGGTLYIGVTSNLAGRVYQHKSAPVDAFTKRYKVDRLVYYEAYDTIDAAILRERQMKKWNLEGEADREGQSGLDRPLSFNRSALSTGSPPSRG